jgi:TolB-like protein/tetratricopeptide (TPR) repeat protein
MRAKRWREFCWALLMSGLESIRCAKGRQRFAGVSQRSDVSRRRGARIGHPLRGANSCASLSWRLLHARRILITVSLTTMPDTARLTAALAGRYAIERELGAGGMATVYLARDLKHDRDIALKVLRPELAAALGAERFLEEIRISAKLDHPHILTLIDSGATDGFVYYVLPFVRGESLRDKLNREKQLGIEEALAITKQVASALDYAHRQGVVHRDIKPENILIQEGEAVVADFGIALAVREAGGPRLTESGLSLGTPQYMSPEQATGGRELDARSDVYSLAAVVYEMLAGEPPHTGPTVQAVIAKLLTERPTRIRTVRDTVPEGIDTAVAKALAKIPADRFAGAAEFAAALTAREAGRSASWRRRRRVAVSASIASAVALAAFAAVWHPWRRPATAAAPGTDVASVAVVPSVAVMYLHDLSRDTADAAIADGLTEELIARLSNVSGLRVASRYASLSYRGRRAADPRQVGRDLGVRYVLDGTLRRSGQGFRVVLSMADATGGFNVWGQAYELPLDEIFSVEDSVAIQVAEAVLGRLSMGDRARLAPAAVSASADAYQAYLKGRVAIRVRTAAAATTAVARYREAIALDPRFARAWAGLAHALSLARDWGWAITGIAPDSLQALAALAAKQALTLDSSSADSWLAAAMVLRADDIRRALVLHRRAVTLDPGSVEALHQLAWGYLGNGELDSAIAFERQALARDPYYAFAYSGLGEMLNISGRPAEALAVLAQGIAVDSTNAALYWQRADALLDVGRVAEAQAAVDRAAALGFDALGVRLLRSIARLRGGDTASVRAELPAFERTVEADLLRSRGGLAYTTCGLLSALHGQLGDVDGAVRWAQNVAHWPRRFYAVVFSRHWFWSPVRSDPHFQTFLASLRT